MRFASRKFHTNMQYWKGRNWWGGRYVTHTGYVLFADDAEQKIGI